MDEYRYIIAVTAATPEEADQVIAERIDHDEDYGFPYEVAIVTHAPLPNRTIPVT